MEIGIGISLTRPGAALDTTAPTCTITLSQYTFKIGDTATVTFTFSEEPVGFTSADVTAPSGSLSAFGVTGNPLVYTATFTPSASTTDATNVITVGTGWTDPAGNPPAGPSQSSNYTVDTTAPTMTITSTETSPSPTLPVPVAFTLSEVATDFAVGDLTLNGCTVANFAGSGTAYTCEATPTTANGTFTIDIAANAFHDAAGNGNTAATQFSFTSNTYKLIDLFTTNAAAPITSPRTCEPLGTLVIFDTNATKRVSITSSALQADSVPADYNQIGGRSNGTFARGAGLSLHGLVSGSWINSFFGWSPNTAIDLGSSEASVFGKGSNTSEGAVISQVITSGDLVSVLRSVGSFMISRATSGSYKLIWVGKTSNSANLYVKWGTGNNVWVLDDLKVAQLSAPWTTDYGIATNRVASPAIGETTTSLADGFVEMTWTAATNAVWNLYVRRGADDTHTYCVRCDQAGSTIKLIEINGSETEKDSKAQTWTNGVAYRLVVYMEGNTIKTWVANTLKANYASATYNNTATGVKTDQAGSDLVTWPIVISGTALTSLQRVFP